MYSLFVTLFLVCFPSLHAFYLATYHITVHSAGASSDAAQVCCIYQYVVVNSLSSYQWKPCSLANHLGAICAESAKVTEGLSNKLRTAVCAEQDKLKKFRTESGRVQVATMYITFFLALMTLIIPAWVCLVVFFTSLPFTIITYICVWTPQDP